MKPKTNIKIKVKIVTLIKPFVYLDLATGNHRINGTRGVFIVLGSNINNFVPGSSHYYYLEEKPFFETEEEIIIGDYSIENKTNTRLERIRIKNYVKEGENITEFQNKRDLAKKTLIAELKRKEKEFKVRRKHKTSNIFAKRILQETFLFDKNWRDKVPDDIDFELIKQQEQEPLDKIRGLSGVHQVGNNRLKMLNEIGITEIEHLASQNPANLRDKLIQNFPNRGWIFFGGGADIFNNMVMYARSLVKKKAIPISKPKFPTRITEIYLDLEYIPGAENFLYGVAIRNKNKIKYHQFFCEELENKLKPATDFLELLNEYTDYVVYTWAGYSADFPQIKLDLNQLNKNHVYNNIARRHIDLFKLCERCVALPLYSYSMKSVVPYLKIPEKETKIKDGFGCLFSFYEYLKSKDESIKKDILEYNLEDIKKLIEVKNWMHSFLSGHTNLPIVEIFTKK